MGTGTGTEVPHPLHPGPLILGTPTPTSTGSTSLMTTTTTTPPDGGGDFMGETFGAEGEKREKNPVAIMVLVTAESAAVMLRRARGGSEGLKLGLL